MSGLSVFGGRRIDQDWVDRLNGHWTVLLISAMSAGAFLARFFFLSISCLTPAHSTAAFNTYAHQVCLHKQVFIKDPGMFATYDPSTHQDKVVSWHLWFPVILFLQASVFKAPAVVWQLLKQLVGVNMNETVSTLSASQAMKPEKRGYIFRDAALVISRTTTNRCIVGILYLFVKFLFCVNLLAQFIFLTVVVKDRIGIKANATEILSYNETTVPAFPRNVLCDIHIKHFENIQSYTLTCDLVINDEFEKFYVVLWFWVLAVFLVSAVNFMMWFACLFVPCVRTSRITSYVTAFNRNADSGAGLASTFVTCFLGVDGVWLITMIARNSSELVAADLTRHLFQIYKETHTGRNVGLQPLYSQQIGSHAQASALPASQDIPLATFNPGSEKEEQPLVGKRSV
ncbi:innexin-11-like [Gigantopelta aegis]|uniref:innexin-11-like n=1 Tax=Gigantopelta aegis TaxID=1735272 RepID=UPI001B88A6E9|nr:innexin-11-like [Gigantopelta aegis]